MRQLSTLQTYIFAFGAFMMLVGSASFISPLMPYIAEHVVPETMHRIGACLYAIGAVCFATMQMSERYEGRDFIIRRLRRIQLMGDICFLVAAVLMIENAFMLAYPFFLGRGSQGLTFYFQYIHNNWAVFLLIAAILEVYSTHRIAYSIKKS